MGSGFFAAEQMTAATGPVSVSGVPAAYDSRTGRRWPAGDHHAGDAHGARTDFVCIQARRADSQAPYLPGERYVGAARVEWPAAGHEEPGLDCRRPGCPGSGGAEDDLGPLAALRHTAGFNGARAGDYARRSAARHPRGPQRLETHRVRRPLPADWPAPVLS